MSTQLNRAVQDAMNKVLAEQGISVQAVDVDMQSECIGFVVHHEAVQTPEERSFRALATQYGLSPDDWGREFTINGRRFKLCGLKTRAPKFPILGHVVGQRENVYKFTSSGVQHALMREPKPVSTVTEKPREHLTQGASFG